MNKVILRGHVGQDPRITEFQNGGKVAQFTFATTEPGFTKSDGTKVEPETSWHNIVVKRTGLADVCKEHVKKGNSLLLVGKIHTRTYQDNSGQTRYVTEIYVDELELLGTGQKREQAPAPAPEYVPAASAQPAPAAPDGGDLPF